MSSETLSGSLLPMPGARPATLTRLNSVRPSAISASTSSGLDATRARQRADERCIGTTRLTAAE